MDNNELGNNFESLDIDPIFHRFETNSPFTHCSKCYLDLIHSFNNYVIHKEWGTRDLQSEFALCRSCVEDLKSATSVESRNRVNEFIKASGGLGRHSDIIQNASEEMQQRENVEINHCVICTDYIRRPGAAHSLSCMVFQSKVLSLNIATAICGNCNDKLVELLSEETRDSWDGFYQSIIHSPPVEMVDLPRPTRPALIF